MIAKELIERFHNVDVDIEANEERIAADTNGCNCDLDYQCFNIDCRERSEREKAYWGRYFTTAMIDAYRPIYQPLRDHD